MQQKLTHAQLTFKEQQEDDWDLKSPPSKGKTLGKSPDDFEDLLDRIDRDLSNNLPRLDSLESASKSRKQQLHSDIEDPAPDLEQLDAIISQPKKSVEQSSASITMVQALPMGFTASDDLNKDGKIDRLEYQIKVENLKHNILNKLDSQVFNQYKHSNQTTVDLYHKLAFSFEKAYRLGKKAPEKAEACIQEIVSCFGQNASYIQEEPMPLFFSLFFCVMYRNKQMVEFIRRLSQKMVGYSDNKAQILKISKLFELIDLHGIDRLRAKEDKAACQFNHWMLYEAMDARLRVVYAKIIKATRRIQLRDVDGRVLLETRDYELIRTMLQKQSNKVDVTAFYDLSQHSLKSLSYRQYNAAYFEEVLLSERVDERVARNYRERFLVDATSIFHVLQMYAKMDYLREMLAVDVSQLSKAQFLELFQICWRHDSFRVALHIYLTHLSSTDISRPLASKYIEGLKSSVRCFEAKLFFVLEAFDVFDIAQLNELVDTLQIAFFRKDLRRHPMLSQFNPVKVSLLIYRISWMIECKKIYSLITKCQILNNYILDSLVRYLESVDDVSHLYRLMREPVLATASSQDSLDIMLQMNLDRILNHPVIVEVLNLAFEGQYSIDSSPVSLSHTFSAFFEMNTLDEKEISAGLWQNIKNFGVVKGDRRQSSLMFHIWKYSLQQRQMDEVVLTASACFSFLTALATIIIIQKGFKTLQLDYFGQTIVEQTHLMFSVEAPVHALFCHGFVQEDSLNLTLFGYQILIIDILASAATVGFFTQVLQQLLTFRLKENSAIPVGECFFQTCLIFNSARIVYVAHSGENPLFYDICEPFYKFSPEEESLYRHRPHLLLDIGHYNTYTSSCSLSVIIATLYVILLFRRTERYQHILVMLEHMVYEAITFFSVAGVILLLFFVLIRINHGDVLEGANDLYSIGKDILDTFNGLLRDGRYQDFGRATLTSLQVLSQVFFVGLLGSLFVLRYVKVNHSLEAIKRKNIIRLKNNVSYDPIYGAFTMSFFPINVALFPAIPGLLLLKSRQLSDIFLKIQYANLILMYILGSTIVALPVGLLLIFKTIINQVYVSYHNKRPLFRGQGFLEFLAVLLTAPLLVFGSLTVDLLALSDLLMKDEKHFEFKYQPHDPLASMDKAGVITSLIKQFIGDYEPRKAQMTKEDLKDQKTKQFHIIANFHSFFCRGDKDYAASMANVKIFNLTKLLANKASIPHAEGHRNLDALDFDLMYNVMTDAVLYNYYEALIQAHRRDICLSTSTVEAFAYAHENYSDKKMQAQADWYRKLSEPFSFVSISAIARAYTEISKEIKEFQEETQFFSEQRRFHSIRNTASDLSKEVSEQFLEVLEEASEKLEEFERLKQWHRKQNKAITHSFV